MARGEATVRVFSGGAPLSPIDNSRAPRSIKRKEDETGTASAITAGAPTARRTSAGDSVWARRTLEEVDSARLDR